MDLLASAPTGDEVPESIDAPAQPIFSKTPYNTLALTVLFLRELDISHCGIRLILSKGEQLILYSPRYPWSALACSVGTVVHFCGLHPINHCLWL